MSFRNVSTHCNSEDGSFHLLAPLEGAGALLPEPAHRLAGLAAAAVSGLLVMGASLQVSQEAVAEHQFLEQAKRPLQAALAHLNFERLVTPAAIAGG
jgi:hypothetical protein